MAMSSDHITRLVTAAIQGVGGGTPISIGCIVIIQGELNGNICSPQDKKMAHERGAHE